METRSPHPDGKRVFITGASGFVGGRTSARLISLGHKVRAVVRRSGTAPPGVDEVLGDFVEPGITDRAAAGAQWVIHCAATGSTELELARRVNVEGTQTVVDAALAAGCERYVHISTGSVYRLDGLERVDEDAPLKTEGDSYGLTKAEGDRIVLDAFRHDLPGAIFRPGAILGAGPTSTWAIRIPDRVRDRSLKLPGGGRGVIPYVHVENLVDAILLALTSNRARSRIYNVVDGQVTWQEFTDEIRSWFGTAPLDEAPDSGAAGGGFRGTFDASRIREELGYAPARTYRDGMNEAERYWREARVATGSE